MRLQQVSQVKKPLNPIALGLALAFGFAPLSSFAEEAADKKAEEVIKEAAQDSGASIEVVTVTARHKVESLQSTPIAVSAFGSDQMKEEKIEGLADISSRVPGFQMNMYNSSEPELFMRGIGSDIESAGAGAAVGMYIDGVYISRGTGAAMDLYDLQSVEVLRGPQGTLYGKNVVGGAINFITKRPSDGEAEGSVEATIGDYGTYELKGFVTGGLTDTLAGKLALSGVTRDGYGENTHTGNSADDLSRYSARGQLLFTPTTNLEMLLTAGYSTTDATPRMKHMAIPSDRNAAFVSDDPRKDASSVDNYEDSENSSLSLQIDYDTSFGRFTSITAYRGNDYSIYENAAAGLVDSTLFYDPWAWAPCEDTDYRTCATPEEIASMQPDDEWLSLKAEDSSQISQEFRLSGGDDKFSWLAGAFFMKEDIARKEAVHYWFDTPWGTTVGNSDTPWEASDENWNPIGTYDDSTLGNTTNNITNSYAVFGNATYAFTEKLSMTAGLRWSKDEKEFSGTAYGRRFDNATGLHTDVNGDLVENYAFETSDSWDEWTPSVNLDYQATDDIFYYVSVAKGYKSGGYNGEGMENAEEAVTTFLPEVAWNYETGFKVQALEDTLRVNGALFYTDYSNIQSTVWVETGDNTPDNLTVVNGSGRAQGFELETIALLTEQFSISGSYGYLDAEFTEELVIDGDDMNGNKMRRSPEHSFNINATYQWELSNIGEMSARVGYQYTSDFFFDNSNDPLTAIEAQSNVDASIMLRAFDDTWSLQLWIKNATDELNMASATNYLDTVFSVYQPPRTIGLTASYNF